jgi:hypothetical protein
MMNQSFYDYRNFAEISKFILISDKFDKLACEALSATTQRMERSINESNQRLTIGGGFYCQGRFFKPLLQFLGQLACLSVFNNHTFKAVVPKVALPVATPVVKPCKVDLDFTHELRKVG